MKTKKPSSYDCAKKFNLNIYPALARAMKSAKELNSDPNSSDEEEGEKGKEEGEKGKEEGEKGKEEGEDREIGVFVEVYDHDLWRQRVAQKTTQEWFWNIHWISHYQ